MGGVFQTAGIRAEARDPSFLDPGCPSFFVPGGMTARPTRFITAINPATGALTYWEHAGQPVIMSRDLAVCKRVRRVSRKLLSATTSRSGHRRKR